MTGDLATALVPFDPFHAQTPRHQQAAYAPASIEAATRVETVGRALLAANPQTNLKPMLRTIGAPQPEIFHVGTDELNITEGLVNLCKTDGQLAGVLAHEIAAMVAERETVAWPKGRAPERDPPGQVRVGNDLNSLGETPDMTHLAELARYEKTNGGPKQAAPRPPDPRVLARTIFIRAGYSETEFDAAAPLLKTAAGNLSFETQFKSLR
jgi:hypothetical protein